MASDLSVEARIEQGMFGEHRSDSNIARNRYRHPVGTLSFLGLEDGMTVMEIWPGAGWYTEVLAPVMRYHGQYIVAAYDVDVPDQPEYRYRLQMDLLDKFSNTPEIYDQDPKAIRRYAIALCTICMPWLSPSHAVTAPRSAARGININTALLVQ
ncbi:hypothetical protein ACFL1V_10875 [Pseudomonadota bacterium]